MPTATSIYLGGPYTSASTMTGAGNTGFGKNALYNNTLGNSNTAVGVQSLYYAKSNNAALGYQACYYVKGSNKTCIGYSSGPTATDSTTTNVVYLGSSSTSKIISGVTSLTTYSDKRLKNIKSEYKTGLEAIREIVPVNFTYKKDEDKTLRIGVVAQDLQKVLPDAVEENGDGYLVVNQGNIFYTLLNTVKQLDDFVQGIINELKVQFEKITTLDSRVKVLEEENKLLKEQIADINKRLEKLEK